MFLSKGKAKIKNQAGFFFVCVWLATSLAARKPAFLHHLWGKHNYQALFNCFQTADRIYAKVREIIRIWTKLKWNYSAISQVYHLITY